MTAQTLKKSLITLAALSLAAIGTQAHAQVVISEVYGGGGNTGSTFTNDFVELYNNGTTAFTFTNYSLQYSSATGTGAFGSTTSVLTTFSGTIAAKGFFLVQEAKGAGGTTALPTPDATGVIAISGTTGQMALVSGTTPLATTDFTGSTPAGASIVDFVGFGPTAARFEGTGPAPVISNTTSTSRVFSTLTSTFQDTNNNNADFTTPATPTPTGSGLAAAPEPSGIVAMVVGMGALGLVAARRRRQAV